jgi:IS605 OrfB family transposase
VIVHQAHRFALDPTPAQARALSAHRGAARLAVNWCLALVKALMDQREAEAGYGIAPEHLTPDRDRWFCSFTREVERADPAPVKPAAVIGVACLSRDGVHKLTTALANEFGTTVAEDLNVAGTRRDRRLARAIADAGFAEIRRQLAYKTLWRGSCLVVADRWYPSSKTCSDCGVVKAELPLPVRVFCCDSCGSRVGRDRNAARDLASLVARSTTGTTTCGLVAMRRPPRAGQPDQTRTSRAGPFVTTA